MIHREPDMPEAENCASRLKILADENRLAVLRLLLQGPSRVGDLAAVIGIEQTLLSHHLKVLREAGLVSTERDGKAVIYQLAPGVAAADQDKPMINVGCCKLLLE
jgi:ArsR family transcriptional regulator